MIAKGTFEITMQGEPPFDTLDGVTLGRAAFKKRFSGALEGNSEVHMLASRTPVENSAGYVAVERIVGSLDGRSGSFVVLQTGVMTRGERSLQITIVPDSGTGQGNRIFRHPIQRVPEAGNCGPNLPGAVWS